MSESQADGFTPARRCCDGPMFHSPACPHILGRIPLPATIEVRTNDTAASVLPRVVWREPVGEAEIGYARIMAWAQGAPNP